MAKHYLLVYGAPHVYSSHPEALPDQNKMYIPRESSRRLYDNHVPPFSTGLLVQIQIIITSSNSFEHSTSLESFSISATSSG